MPLRRSSVYICHAPSAPSNPPKPGYLYEAQISIVIVGIDHYTWTAYGTEDTYFGTDRYDHVGTRGSRTSWDPIVGRGGLDINCPTWDPREYFLKAVEFRARSIVKDWEWVVRGLEDAVEQRYAT